MIVAAQPPLPVDVRRVMFSALVNDRAASQVDVAARVSGGREETSAGLLGLLGGVQRSVVPGRSITAVHENYVQQGSVQAGRNALTFRLGDVPGALRAKVTVEAAELVATPHDAVEIVLAVPEAPVRVAVGETVTFAVEVRRRGVRADLPVTLEQRHDPALIAVTPRSVFRERLGDRERLTYTVRGVAPGEALVLYRAGTAYNQAGSEVRVRVVPAGASEAPLRAYLVVGGMLIAGAAAVVGKVRRA